MIFTIQITWSETVSLELIHIFVCNEFVICLEENELIEESLRAKQKDRKLPRMREEKFTNAGQTVLIWCFRDFCQNKKLVFVPPHFHLWFEISYFWISLISFRWHEDTFNAQSRQLRQLKSLQKRHSYWNDSFTKNDENSDEKLIDDATSSVEEEDRKRPKKKSKVSTSQNRNIVSSRGKRCIQRYQKVIVCFAWICVYKTVTVLFFLSFLGSEEMAGKIGRG